MRSEHKLLTCCAADPHDNPEHQHGDWCDCCYCTAERAEEEVDDEEEEDYEEEDDEEDEPCYHCRGGF